MRYNHKTVVKKLMEKRANINAEDERGLSPLYFPIGEDPDVGIEEQFSSESWSPLQVAAFLGEKRKVELLISQSGIDVNELLDGLTPLFGAIRKGHSGDC